MSELQHTPEPWIYQEDSDKYTHIIRREADQRLIIAYGPQSSKGNVETNMRRIVACVNACAGMPTDDLEQCPSGGLFHIADHANELVKQRDELLAALELIANESTRNLGSARIVARSAIASVKANTK